MPDRVRALYEYTSEEVDDLTFDAGQIIDVTGEDGEWFSGRYLDAAQQLHQGLFPQNYVEELTDEAQSPSEECAITQDFDQRDSVLNATDSQSTAGSTHLDAFNPRVVKQSEIDPPDISATKVEESAPKPVDSLTTRVSDTKASNTQITSDDIASTQNTAPEIDNAKIETSSQASVGDKNNFRDRIKAFNQAGAAPRPGGPSSSQNASFVKKAFVAAPPSRDAYVPIPSSSMPMAKLAGAKNAPIEQPDIKADPEDQPKPTSLKERIALLQQRQLEQATSPKQTARKSQQVPVAAKSPESAFVQGSLERVATDEIPTANIADPPSPSIAAQHSIADAPAPEDSHSEPGDVDPEVQRRIDLRNRMAKMSGGMGMAGMLGMGFPQSKSAELEKDETEAPSNLKSQTEPQSEHESEDPTTEQKPEVLETERAPPVVPLHSRPTASEAPSLPQSQSEGFESDDELSSTPEPPPGSSMDEATASDLSDLGPLYTRAPPPPPRTVLPSRSRSRSQTEDTVLPEAPEDEGTAYEGDYDTDIASGDTPKRAPRPNHPSLPKSLSEEPQPFEATQETGERRSAEMPRTAPPPPPRHPASPPQLPIALPPGAPPKSPPGSKSPPVIPLGQSPGPASAPVRPPTPERPPPVQPQRSVEEQRPTEYDPFNYERPSGQVHSPRMQPLQKRTTDRSTPRSSLDVQRHSVRRSTDLARVSGEFFLASDLDLAEASHWWTVGSSPPALQGRTDVLLEIDENTNTKRGKKITALDVYVLYGDYSQTAITVQYDHGDPHTALTLEQRHEEPPRLPRQERLEQIHAEIGAKIAQIAETKGDTVVGDGTASDLALEIIRGIPQALLPVGKRSFGAVVYVNLANASVQQHDHIKAGDIVTFRQATFSGHRGVMKSKYSVDVGKADHVGIVSDWDGSRKKLHAWEQGREGKKVRLESFKLDDLKSGEVKVWRVMPRGWVGWDE